MVLVLELNIKRGATPPDTFIKDLAQATVTRYAEEYSKLRSYEDSYLELSQHLRLIKSCNGFMNPFVYTQFKSGICHAINTSDKHIRAELCFIHDLMLEEYHKIIPCNRVEMEVGINEFYNLFRTHL